MDAVLLIARRLVLAGVFIVTSLSKLADRPGSRQALVDFGVPTPLKILLPLAKLGVAATSITSGRSATGLA
jgi:uncharacterized membrane protein YphA (DoxX/SURF4 family)